MKFSHIGSWSCVDTLFLSEEDYLGIKTWGGELSTVVILFLYAEDSPEK
jgi:hypothetical protein